MTEEKLIEIFETTKPSEYEPGKDKAFEGLKILEKYTLYLIQGAEQDQIFSENIDKLIASGITEEDCIKLAELSWFIEDGTYLAHFV